MAGTFDGSIFAEIGANTSDYEAAMAKIVSSTQNAFNKAQDAAVNSANKMVQMIGQVMAQLANNGQSLGQRLGNAYSTGLKLSLGQIQRIAASIGEKIPEPIKNGFSKAFTAVQAIVQRMAGAIPTPIKSAFSSATSSVISFASQISSALSNAFNTVGAKATVVADKISNSFGGKITSAVTNLATKLGTGLSSGFSSMSNSATSALNGISQRFASASSAGEKLRSTVGSIISAFSLMAIAQKGIQALSGAMDGAINRVDTMNRFPKTMALFGYSAEQSKASIDKLSKGIEGLPTPLDAAVKSAQQLSITTGSLEKGTDLALAFNNAMLGYGATTENAEMALRQFNQSLGSGKMYAEEFNSVSEAAPGLMSKMAESFGFGKNGVQDLKAALSDGTITAQEFADKMIELNNAQGGFAEMAKASSGGIRTSFKNLKTAVVRGLADMMMAFDSAAKANGMKTIAESINSVKPAIDSVFSTVNSIMPNLVASFARIGKMVNIDFSPLSNGFKSAFALLNTALGEFAKTGELTTSTIDKIKSKISEIGPTAIAAWALLNPSSAIVTIMPLISMIGKIGVALGTVGTAMATFGTMVAGGLSTASGIVGAFAGVMSGLPAVFGVAASRGLTVLGGMTSAMSSIASIAMASIGPAAILGLVVAGLGLINNQFGTQISQLLKIATTKGPQIITNLVNGITSQLPSLIASGTDLIAKFANAITVLLPVIIQAGVQLITSLVQGVGQNASSLISSAIQIIGTFISSIASALPQILAVGVQLILNLVQGIVQNIPLIIQYAQQIISNFGSSLQANMPSIINNGIAIITNLISGIVQLLPAVLQIAVQVITGFISGIVQSG